MAWTPEELALIICHRCGAGMAVCVDCEAARGYRFPLHCAAGCTPVRQCVLDVPATCARSQRQWRQRRRAAGRCAWNRTCAEPADSVTGLCGPHTLLLSEAARRSWQRRKAAA